MLKDTPLDGSAPLLLYGYGAYGIPMDPSFSIRNLPAGRDDHSEECASDLEGELHDFCLVLWGE